MAAIGRNELGRIGEDLACAHLEEQGFTLVERNWRTARGEIDVIARKGRAIIFVEVKTRRGRAFGEPEEALTPLKVRRIRGLAAEYLSGVDGGAEVRFDVISVVMDASGKPLDLRHLAGAF